MPHFSSYPQSYYALWADPEAELRNQISSSHAEEGCEDVVVDWNTIHEQVPSGEPFVLCEHVAEADQKLKYKRQNKALIAKLGFEFEADV